MQARHVWLPEVGASAFPAVAEPLRSSRVQDEGILVTALPSLEHILAGPGIRQLVVLRANGASLQLVIDGADVAAGPVAITFQVHGFGAIRQAFEHLTTLRRIMSSSSRLHASPPWTPTTRKLREALIALDGRAAGASYYDVAIVLYGVEYVERNWPRLKSTMRHHLRRGLALSTGGYRHLLR